MEGSFICIWRASLLLETLAHRNNRRSSTKELVFPSNSYFRVCLWVDGHSYYCLFGSSCCFLLNLLFASTAARFACWMPWECLWDYGEERAIGKNRLLLYLLTLLENPFFQKMTGRFLFSCKQYWLVQYHHPADSTSCISWDHLIVSAVYGWLLCYLKLLLLVISLCTSVHVSQVCPECAHYEAPLIAFLPEVSPHLLSPMDEAPETISCRHCSSPDSVWFLLFRDILRAPSSHRECFHPW